MNIENKLRRLLAAATAGIRPEEERMWQEILHGWTERRGETASLDRLLDDLRIILKYQQFDLEATRRENHRLRQLLDDRKR